MQFLFKQIIEHYYRPQGAEEIVECVRKYVEGISQNMQSLSPYYQILLCLACQIFESVNIRESIDINQSASIQLINFIQSKRRILSEIFLFSHNPA